MSEDEEYFRGYVKGYEAGLEEAWDELIALTTRGYTSREIQVLAKTKRSSLKQRSAALKRKILKEEGVDLTDKEPKGTVYSKVSPGTTYLVEERRLDRTISIFNGMTNGGARGLCIVRTYPPQISHKLSGQTSLVWLTKTEASQDNSLGLECVSPSDLAKLSSLFRGFLKNGTESVVVLEGVEYLVRHNDFNSVLKFLQNMMDQVILSKSILLLPLNPDALDAKDLKALECEIEDRL